MTVCITGASQGIGAALARAFAAEPSARLALVARSEGKLRAVAAESAESSAPKPPSSRATSPTPPPSRATGDAVGASVGVPDVLVNNAGHFAPGGFAETTPETFGAQLAVNLTSAFLVTRAFLPAMLARAARRRRARAAARPAACCSWARSRACAATPAARPTAPPSTACWAWRARCARETLDAGLSVTTLLPGATVSPSWDGADVETDRLMPAEDVARLAVEVCRMSPLTRRGGDAGAAEARGPLNPPARDSGDAWQSVTNDSRRLVGKWAVYVRLTSLVFRL